MFFVFSLSLYQSNISLADTSITGADLIKSKFNLVDHHGKNVTEKDFYGKYLLVFFGFTNCPKICPQALANLTLVLKKMGKKSDLIHPLFISIDPERDTPERISEYLKNFDAKIIGLTGTSDNIERASQSYRAYFGKIKGGDKEQYSFDHSSVIYLMDKQGNFVSSFSSNLETAKMVEQISALLKE